MSSVCRCYEMERGRLKSAPLRVCRPSFSLLDLEGLGKLPEGVHERSMEEGGRRCFDFGRRPKSATSKRRRLTLYRQAITYRQRYEPRAAANHRRWLAQLQVERLPRAWLNNIVRGDHLSLRQYASLQLLKPVLHHDDPRRSTLLQWIRLDEQKAAVVR